MRKIIVTLTAVLVASLFLIQVTADDYDPWLDTNDDGIIDIFDIVALCNRYQTTGTPINKTSLLLELLDRVQALENQTGWLPAPAYDSGWINTSLGEIVTLQHNLGTKDVLVYMTARAPPGWYESEVIHQNNYGSDNANTRQTGTFWHNLTETSISFWRGEDDDTVHINWEQVRVQLWKIATP